MCCFDFRFDLCNTDNVGTIAHTKPCQLQNDSKNDNVHYAHGNTFPLIPGQDRTNVMQSSFKDKDIDYVVKDHIPPVTDSWTLTNSGIERLYGEFDKKTPVCHNRQDSLKVFKERDFINRGNSIKANGAIRIGNRCNMQISSHSASHTYSDKADSEPTSFELLNPRKPFGHRRSYKKAVHPELFQDEVDAEELYCRQQACEIYRNNRIEVSRDVMERKRQWYYVAEVVDKASFLIYFLSMFITVTTVLLIVPSLPR